jgi:hypothetical protein
MASLSKEGPKNWRIQFMDIHDPGKRKTLRVSGLTKRQAEDVHVAGCFYPTALWLELFPFWPMALGFAFITTPFAYLHCSVIGALVRNADAIESRTTGHVYMLSISMTALLVAGLA